MKILFLALAIGLAVIGGATAIGVVHSATAFACGTPGC